MTLDVRNTVNTACIWRGTGILLVAEMCVTGRRPETRDRVLWEIGDG